MQLGGLFRQFPCGQRSPFCDDCRLSETKRNWYPGTNSRMVGDYAQKRDRRRRLLTREELSFEEEMAEVRAGRPYQLMMAALNINSKVPL